MLGVGYQRVSKSIKLFFIGTLSPARPLDDLISSLEKIPTPIELNIIGDTSRETDYSKNIIKKLVLKVVKFENTEFRHLYPKNVQGP